MTNQEAIKNIKSKMCFDCGIYLGGGKCPESCYALQSIKALKQEPKKGHWIKDNPFTKPYCSECKTSCIGLHGFDYTMTNFCPNCGADMRGEEDADSN